MDEKARRKRKEEILKAYRIYDEEWMNGDWENAELPPEDEIFECPECKRMFSILDLEIWDDDSDENILEDKIPCSFCYENAMGEDL